jgi:hypothetical protein
MRIKIAAFVLFAAIFAPACFAQNATPAAPATNQGAFSIQGKAIGIFAGGTDEAATDVGATLAVTPNVSLRSDNIVAGSGQSFLAGVQYFVPLATLLKSTNLPASKFQFYVVGEAGITRNGTLPAQFAGSAGGGVNYDPTSSGKFSINLFEGRWVSKLPSGSGVIANGIVISSGLTVSF